MVASSWVRSRLKSSALACKVEACEAEAWEGRQGGFLGALGSVLGGNAQQEVELKETLGFVETYTLVEYVCRGSRICLHLSYPHGWTASYRNDSDEWVPMLSGQPTRPTYQEIEVALQDNDVPFKFSEFDMNSIV